MSTVKSSLTGLRKEIEYEQPLRAKQESSLQSSLEELEKIKANFEIEKKYFETEKAALIQHAKNAKSQFAPVTEELAGLKCHISQMTQDIFGK